MRRSQPFEHASARLRRIPAVLSAAMLCAFSPVVDGKERIAAASVSVTANEITLANDIITMRLDETGVLRELSRAGGDNLLANGGQGYWNAHSAYAKETRGFVRPGGPGRIVREADDLVEIAFRHEPRGRWSYDAFPFNAHLHYVLRGGESGFYLFMTLEYTPNMPRAQLAQYAYNLRLDPDRFDYIAVDHQRRHVSPAPEDLAGGERIMDATWRLKDGRVATKYDYCHDIVDDDYHVYGWISSSKKEGVWLIQPSAEYYSVTPFRQFISSHQTDTTPVIIWQPQCTHYGGTPIECEPGDSWHKLYGPLFFYLNTGGDVDSIWAGAHRTAGKLAEEWPYGWMEHEWFPVERGEVTGRLRFTDGRPASNAWVILSPPGNNWSREVRGYHFWAKTDDQGRFTIEHVRAGAYILFATGADQFEESEREGVTVEAGGTTSLGTVAWKPVVRGERIWQIGTADRSSGEFRNGDDYRHWGMWRRYPTDFPDNVHFVIGRSEERSDWNFAHWSWHSGDDPAWRIEFDMHYKTPGKAYLTFGIAASAPYNASKKALSKEGTTDVRVLVNGREVGRIQAPFSGSVAPRSGRQSTTYSHVTLPFDAALLTEGENIISLQHETSDQYKAGDEVGERGAGPGYVMYDAIRLEIARPSTRSMRR